MTTRTHFLVVGTGSIAKRHLNNLLTLFPDGVIGCISASGRKIAEDELDERVQRYGSFSEAIAETPKFAIVASPASLHLEHTKALLEAGIHVLIEKPLSDSSQKCAEAKELLISNDSKLAVSYNLRFMPSAQKVHEFLKSGRMGRIHAVLIDVGQYLPDWRPHSDYRRNVSAQRQLGGGVLLELSHELDYLLWLLGPIESVYCLLGRSGTLDIDVEDQVDAALRSQHGVAITLHMDFLQRSPSRTCKIVGEHGNLLWDLMRNSVSWSTSSAEPVTIFDDPHYDRNAMYLRQLEHFSRVVEGEQSPSVNIYDALLTMELIEAMRRSASLGQVVRVGI